MKIVIRDALPEDANAISDVIRHSMGYENPPLLIKENIIRLSENNSDKILVAEYNNRIIGFIHAEGYDCLYAPHLKDLMSLAVKKEFQHQGVGSRLLKEIENWAVATGRRGMRVLSSSTRIQAHEFYLAKGYVNEKTQLNFHKYF